MKYRSDIDGLRAVAVIPVILYHTDIEYFSGGYVGVDVFFVISGYLITKLLTDDLSRGHLSIRKFYERRIRRIFPALFTVLIFTLIVSSLILLPEDYISESYSALSAALFSANIYFWANSGYFDAPASALPLLHTWSLAVEEQFYIVFPLLLLTFKNANRNVLAIIFFVLFFVSLGISQWYVVNDTKSAFYLPHSRAWELLIGAFLALGVLPDNRSRLMRETLSITGITLISWSVFTYTDKTPFPGFSALAPSIGAALIIYAGRSGRSLPFHILTMKSIVFIGLISYSLYLWHWPIIVLTKYYVVYPLSIQ
jgi:peptidoglycan/LPS O-acetylase OafA/YrhL